MISATALESHDWILIGLSCKPLGFTAPETISQARVVAAARELDRELELELWDFSDLALAREAIRLDLDALEADGLVVGRRVKNFVEYVIADAGEERAQELAHHLDSSQLGVVSEARTFAAIRISLRHLRKFAYIASPASKLADLVKLASEDWTYRRTPSSEPYPVLSGYLNYTFRRVQQQGKLKELNDRTCFNTGLVTDSNEEIFAFFREDREQRQQKWFLSGFYEASAGVLRDFKPLPEPATYFEDASKLLYDPKRELDPDIEHIVQDNRDRFPDHLQTNDHHRRLALRGAIDEARIRAERNYKIAVPQFYWGEGGDEDGRLQLLLPLAFDDPKRADVAIAIEEAGGGYHAATILTLDMAYKNARLVTKPESDWLEA